MRSACDSLAPSARDLKAKRKDGSPRAVQREHDAPSSNPALHDAQLLSPPRTTNGLTEPLRQSLDLTEFHLETTAERALEMTIVRV